LSARRKLIVIAGPTASGKSALALDLAEGFGGLIVNADSQQSYRDLPILTARPTPADEARAPHALFGVLPPTARDTAAAWAARAAAAITASERLPIVVGGTGLYLHTLLVGLPAMPAIPAAVRAGAAALLREIGHAAFHARLAARDPATAARLKVGDTQRLIRAWEVGEATGRPLSAWQADPPAPVLQADVYAIRLMPDRELLRQAVDDRFDQMMAAGALEEVRALCATGLPLSAPIFRVLGAKPLAEHLFADLSMEAAVAQAKAATRQYAKRQTTWFRHQFRADVTLETKYSESQQEHIFPKIRGFLLT
jgi:tRNA dimethylallyltransferase